MALRMASDTITAAQKFCQFLVSMCRRNVPPLLGLGKSPPCGIYYSEASCPSTGICARKKNI